MSWSCVFLFSDALPQHYLHGTDNFVIFLSYDVLDECEPETARNDCYVYKGEMTVLHDGSGSEEVIKDAVLASVEGSMTSGELADSIDDVEKVTYVGESLDDLKVSLGPEETLVEYYYTVETKPGADPDAFTAAIEEGLLESVTRNVADASVGAISSEPIDLEMTECKSLKCAFALSSACGTSYRF